MSIGGTRSHRDDPGLPPLVSRAVELAVELGFEESCRLEQGHLLQALAAGAQVRIGETGTGCGVGLAWLLSGRRPDVHVVSVERDASRASSTRRLFQDVPRLSVVHGDWTEVYDHAPFDLLVLDGGGNGKAGPAADVDRLLEAGGTVVVDDFTPLTGWPPQHDGAPDGARLHWLEHPSLLSTEVRVARDVSTVLGTLVPGRAPAQPSCTPPTDVDQR